MPLTTAEAKEFPAAALQGEGDCRRARQTLLTWGSCAVPALGESLTQAERRCLAQLSCGSQTGCLCTSGVDISIWEQAQIQTHPVYSSIKQLNPMAFICQNDRHSLMTTNVTSSKFPTWDGILPAPLWRVTLCKAHSHRGQSLGNQLTHRQQRWIGNNWAAKKPIETHIHATKTTATNLKGNSPRIWNTVFQQVRALDNNLGCYKATPH